MSVIRDHLVELLERRRLDFERKYAKRTTNPLSGEPGWIPPNPYPPGASEDDFSAFRTRTGIELPDDIKEWLKITNGSPGFFGIDVARQDCNIEWIWQLYPSFQERCWIPVGYSDFGNYYVRVVSKSGGRGGVFHVEATMTDALGYVVASDTLHLAEFVLEEGEALNSGRTYGWPRNKSFVLSKDREVIHVENAEFLWGE